MKKISLAPCSHGSVPYYSFRFNLSMPNLLFIAQGTLTSSRAGTYTDLSGLKGTLENGAPQTSSEDSVPASPTSPAISLSPYPTAAPMPSPSTPTSMTPPATSIASTPSR